MYPFVDCGSLFTIDHAFPSKRSTATGGGKGECRPRFMGVSHATVSLWALADSC